MAILRTENPPRRPDDCRSTRPRHRPTLYWCPVTSAIVDVVIPVHSATRPLRRAAASVLDHTAAPVAVIVVAHNIAGDTVRTMLEDLVDDDRVRVIELQDGIHSPAGPLNTGLDAATAPYVAVMGSDDEFAPGAVDSWLALARRTGAAMVIARVFRVGQGNVAYPPVRPRRTRRLDPVKDRLSYRSAPLGLIERERLGDLRFTENLRSGEDLPYTVHAWFSGHPLAYDVYGPAYLEHPDATDRVSFAGRTVDEDFAFLAHVIDTQWFRSLSRRERTAVGVKILRTQVFDAVANRARIGRWDDDDRTSLQTIVSRILAVAPHAERLISRVDRALLDAALANDSDPGTILHLIERRWHYRSFNALVPRNPFLVFHRQAPFRTLYAGFFLLRTAPKG